MQRTQTICLAILTTIAVGFSLYYLQTVLLPFVIALFIVIGCRPVFQYFESRFKLNQYLAFFVTFSLGAIILLSFVMTVWVSINDLTRNSGAYEERLNAIASWASDLLHESEPAQGETGDSFQLPNVENEAKSKMPNEASGDNGPTSGSKTELGRPQRGAERALASASEDARQAITEFTDYAVSFLKSQILQVARSLSSLLSYGVLILIFVFFLMLGQGSLPENQPPIVRQVEAQVRRYLVMKTVISALTGFAFGFVLWMFGVPLAVLFGLMAFLLNFIPNLGPLIAMLLPLPFLVLDAGIAPIAAISCFALGGAIQFVSGNVVETRIMGQSFDVSPVVLLLALMFFGLVWGIIGMFLATPIISIIKIVLQQYPSTRTLSELIAGRWSESPAEQTSV